VLSLCVLAVLSLCYLAGLLYSHCNAPRFRHRPVISSVATVVEEERRASRSLHLPGGPVCPFVLASPRPQFHAFASKPHLSINPFRLQPRFFHCPPLFLVSIFFLLRVSALPHSFGLRYLLSIYKKFSSTSHRTSTILAGQGSSQSAGPVNVSYTVNNSPAGWANYALGVVLPVRFFLFVCVRECLFVRSP
jgi:hypothetical protein